MGDVRWHQSAARHYPEDLCQTSGMPLRGSGGDENGRLALTTQIISCLAPAIF
jgi:hypothetical protein